MNLDFLALDSLRVFGWRRRYRLTSDFPQNRRSAPTLASREKMPGIQKIGLVVFHPRDQLPQISSAEGFISVMRGYHFQGGHEHLRFRPTVRGVNVGERLFPRPPSHSYDKPAGEAGKLRHSGFLFRERHICAGVQLGEFRVGVSHQSCRYRRVYIFVAASSGTAVKHTRGDVGVAVPHRCSAFHIDTAEHLGAAESLER